jgi:hypothetical protein
LDLNLTWDSDSAKRGLRPGDARFGPGSYVEISMTSKTNGRSTSATDALKPFHCGYRQGSLQAQRLVRSIRSRRSRGRTIAPNELGYVFTRLVKRIEDAGGLAMSSRPIAQRSPKLLALQGELHGLCAGIMDAL